MYRDGYSCTRNFNLRRPNANQQHHARRAEDIVVDIPPPDLSLNENNVVDLPRQVDLNLNFDLPNPWDNPFQAFNQAPFQPSASQVIASNVNFNYEQVNNPLIADNSNNNNAFVHHSAVPNESFHQGQLPQALLPNYANQAVLPNYSNQYQRVSPNEQVHQMPVSQASVPNDFNEYQPVQSHERPPCVPARQSASTQSQPPRANGAHMRCQSPMQAPINGDPFRELVEELRELKVSLDARFNSVQSEVHSVRRMVVGDSGVEAVGAAGMEANQAVFRNRFGSCTSLSNERHGAGRPRHNNYLQLRDLPTFDGNMKNLHPKSFIASISLYFQYNDSPFEVQLLELGRLLKGRAAAWFDINMPKIGSFNHFKERFFNSFWGPSHQNEVRSRVFAKNRYQPSDGSNYISMTDYFTDLVREASFLDVLIPEEALVDHIAQHFPENVRLMLVASNTLSIDEMERQLQRVDRSLGSGPSFVQKNSSQNYPNRNRHFDKNTPRVNMVGAEFDTSVAPPQISTSVNNNLTTHSLNE